PDFLMPLRGVIDSNDIPLNVSRSALTNDRTVRRITDYIAKKIGDRLKSLYSENRTEYIRCWQDVGTFVKFGSLKDDKFKKQVEEIIVFQTTYKGSKPNPEEPKVEVQAAEGDVWQEATPSSEDSSAGDGYTTLKEYLERNKERHENRVYYCTDPATQSTYVELYKNQGLEVLYMDSFIDTNYFIPFLEREYSDVQFSRVDAELEDTLLEEDKTSEIVDPKTNKTRSELVKELFEKALNNSKVTIRTESLKSENPESAPPAMVILPEQMRRLQEMTALLQQQNVQFPEEHTLLVNTSHPMIQKLVEIGQGGIIQGSGQSSSGELTAAMCQHVYDLALFSQKGFTAESMTDFVARSNQLLTRVAERL
ncbi:MAG: molecular chaperone HtpG, partial [Cyanobacteriota bacterium]|nr:molecular chaperone HtpG [Cyanobacteriota bacterium]